MVKQKDIKPFVEVTVGQLLWGYDDPLMSLAKEMSPDAKLPFDQFGLLVGVSTILKTKKNWPNPNGFLENLNITEKLVNLCSGRRGGERKIIMA